MHPILRHSLVQARDYMELGRQWQAEGKTQLPAMAFKRARDYLLTALQHAKVLGLGLVVANVLLALREVGKASRLV